MKDKTRPGATTDAAPTAPLPLRTYFEEYKAETKPSAPLMERILADAAASFPTPVTPPKRAWWQLPVTGWASLATAALACVIWIQLPPQTGTQGTLPGQGVLPGQPTPGQKRQSPGLVPGGEPGGVAKGATSLQLLYSRKTAGGHTHKQRARSGVVMRPGDLVQLQYQASQPAFVMVLSLNRKGEISLFIPYGHKYSARINKGQGYAPASGSLELDDYQGKELFFLLAAQKRFSVSNAKAAIKKLFAQRGQQWYDIRTLPGPWRARVILVRKERRP